MKNLIVLIFALVSIVFTNETYSQDNNSDLKYRRSSLSMILIESDNFPSKDDVMKSWSDYPFPDKYNKHNIDSKSINIDRIQLSDEELLAEGYLKDTIRGKVEIAKQVAQLKTLRFINSDKSEAVLIPSEKKEYQLKIDKVIKDLNLAKQLVSSWFNKDKNGKFDMSLVQERGFYNASDLEANIARGQARGLAALGDAGEELINNTFLTFTKLDFVENEPIARKIRDEGRDQTYDKLSGKPQFLIDQAIKKVDKVYDKTKEGYSLWSKTWLYKLKWNDEIAFTFYNDMWTNSKAFDNTSLFTLEFVGVQYNQSLVTFKLGDKRTQADIIDLALVRNLDNAFAELQKENDVFKPKVPVTSIDPILAPVGKKESLEGGEKFEILEMTYNSRTGKTEYKKIGTVKAEKPVWDNRYKAGEGPEDEVPGPLNGTVFKGSKNVQMGMLLKQVK